MGELTALRRIASPFSIKTLNFLHIGGLLVYGTPKNKSAKTDATAQNINAEEPRKLQDQVGRLEAKLAANSSSLQFILATLFGQEYDQHFHDEEKLSGDEMVS